MVISFPARAMWSFVLLSFAMVRIAGFLVFGGVGGVSGFTLPFLIGDAFKLSVVLILIFKVSDLLSCRARVTDFTNVISSDLFAPFTDASILSLSPSCPLRVWFMIVLSVPLLSSITLTPAPASVLNDTISPALSRISLLSSERLSSVLLPSFSRIIVPAITFSPAIFTYLTLAACV